MLRRSIFLLALLFIAQNVFGQLSPAVEKEIDRLFEGWSKTNSPGGSVGISMDGEVIYSKAFGLASLEYEVPNTPEMRFNIASVSKQFTAMGIVLLHLKGELNIDDDIRKYLTDLPEYNHVVTIRHMLHHTSGLRSLHALLALAGWRGDDSRTNADLYRFMLKQKELNFMPGDDYLYCNTGYMFMAEIIEKISEEKFENWMKANVFKPLGLKNTYVEGNYDRVVARNATSYNFQSVTDVRRSVEYWGYVGSGNIHSTAEDLLKWLKNFHSPIDGWEEAFKLMETLTPFNDGSMNYYAFGVNIGDYYEHKSVRHGGSIGGFRSSVASFPDDKLDIAVLTNSNQGNPGVKLNEIADILLEIDKTQNSGKILDIKGIDLTSEELAVFEGSYWEDRQNFKRVLEIKDDTLTYVRSNGSSSKLIPLSKNRFQMAGLPTEVFLDFKKLENGQMKIQFTENEQVGAILESFDELDLNFDLLWPYIGKYASPELGAVYSITADANMSGLKAHHVRHGEMKLDFIKKDVFQSRWPLGTIKIHRNAFGDIEGMRVSNGRVRDLWFKKM